MRLVELYSHRDPALASALSQGLQLEKSAQGDDMKPKPGTNNVGAMRLVARGAAKLMAADDGPRIAALAFDGWDTHANEGGPVGRLAQLLGGLDGALAEFESGLGARWRDTVIVVATEFGRTARINGTEGTDHGTGTVALLAGGAIKGGRVISDWPGLKPANLYQARDLAPTTDLRAAHQRRAARPSRPVRSRAGGERVSGQRGGEGDEGVGGVAVIPGRALRRARNPYPMCRCSAPNVVTLDHYHGGYGFPGSCFARPGMTNYFVIVSISASSSADSFHSIALTFCSTCSGRVAPAMTLETCGCEASHEKASSSTVWPRCSANACSFSTISSLRGVAKRSRSAGAFAKRVWSGAALPRLYLPVSSPLASGKNGSRPSLYSRRRRQQVLFDAAHQQRVLVLALTRSG